MKKSPEELLTVINSISEGIFTVDLDFNIDFINDSAAKMLELDVSEAVGKKCHEVLNTKACDNKCPLKIAFQTRESVIEEPICIFLKDKPKPICISASLLYDENGEIIGGVETLRDLSLLEHLKKELYQKYQFEDIIGKSNAMQNLFELIEIVAESGSTVLIEGESGVGKELIVRAIHNHSQRKSKPLVSINCSALPSTLLESELFGYVAGAFTDAKKDKKGRFALAEGGTLFLDEIGELSKMIQVKLLRVLQDKKYEPLGSTKSFKADVRFITATNKDLEKLVEEKIIRKDFYYRINVIKIKVPPLRDRMEDIPLLAEHFIKKQNHLHNKKIESISPRALSRLMEYDFPGNVRELENIIEHAFVLCRGVIIQPEHLPEKFNLSSSVPAVEIASNLKEMEGLFLIAALKRNNWNRKKTAKELNVHPSTIYRKLKKVGFKAPKEK